MGGGGGPGIDCIEDDAGTPAEPCGPGLSCCYDTGANAPTCVQACQVGDALACLVPSDCRSGVTAGPDCCATVVLNGGTFPQCTAASFSTACGTCKTTIATSCNDTDTLHLCVTAADCSADVSNPLCCNLRNGTFACISSLVSQAGGFTDCR